MAILHVRHGRSDGRRRRASCSCWNPLAFDRPAPDRNPKGRAPTFPLADHLPSRPIADGARIGHVHLKVADLERALLLLLRGAGLRTDATARQEAAFVSAGGYHRHIGLNTWEGARRLAAAARRGRALSPGDLYPDRAALADALRRCWPPASSWTAPAMGERGLYLRYYDGRRGGVLGRAARAWPVNDKGELAMGPCASTSRTCWRALNLPRLPR